MEHRDPRPAVSPDEQLLRDALGAELRGELRVVSREPYGSGALTGFEEQGGAGGTDRYWYVDTSGRRVEAETGLVLGDPEHPQARVWLHPADPRLPALAAASFPSSAATLMGRLGIAIDDAPQLLVYRPGERAMFRMRSGTREIYLKVVRPKASAAIVRLQESLLAGAVPVPGIVGWSELGIVLTETAAGEPLTSRVEELDPERLLDSIDGLRDAIGVVDVGRDARASLGARHDWYVERLSTALERAAAADHGGPATTAAIELFAGYRRELEAPGAADLVVAPGERRTVHGDLHIGQLFVDPADPSTITGVIDIDTAGLGDPADDEAAFLGHLIASLALARHDARRTAALEALLTAAAARWLERGTAIARVRHRLATHVLAHALVPAERGDLETAAAAMQRGRLLLERG